jgi:hypothetical protein
MNRWRWAALAVLVVGFAVAFLLVPYSSGACPDGLFGSKPACDETGQGLRMMAALLTLFIAFIVFIVGALANPGEGKRS